MENSIQKNSLEKKKVIILGGSTGLGLATAKAAAAEGAYITIVSSNKNRIENALKQLPSDSEGFAVDLRNEQDIKTFFERTGNFDHLVYTAGENLRLGIITQTDLEKARQFFNIRYWGALAAVKYSAALINKGGSITLTSGVAGLRPGSGWGLGASICGAMDAFSRAMAVELAPLRINTVSPGIVRTNLWDNMPEQERNNLYTKTAEALLVGRIGEAEQIAETYIYLMKQQFGTGQSIVVDGGAVLI